MKMLNLDEIKSVSGGATQVFDDGSSIETDDNGNITGGTDSEGNAFTVSTDPQSGAITVCGYVGAAVGSAFYGLVGRILGGAAGTAIAGPPGGAIGQAAGGAVGRNVGGNVGVTIGDFVCP